MQTPAFPGDSSDQDPFSTQRANVLNNWEEIICNTSPIPQFGAYKHPLHYPAGDSFLDNQELASHPHRQESQLTKPGSKSFAINC